MKRLLPQPLSSQTAQLRSQLPATVQAKLWTEPTASTLLAVIKHLRTLRYLLYYYLPFSVTEHCLKSEQPYWQWETGTLMFTDLAGFTTLTQSCSQQGAQGARFLAKLINTYFSRTIDIISASEGDLLEFTGDATLIKFEGSTPEQATAKAIRAGLRLQRMMAEFNAIETFQETQSIGMRIGIHSGQFLSADVGTPMRMMRILLGQTVRLAKQTESLGKVGKVCISEQAAQGIQENFQLIPHQSRSLLIEDNLSSDRLGDFELTPQRRRFPRSLLLNHSSEEMMREINHLLGQTTPLANYIAPPVLKLLVENAGDRAIPPTLSQTAVLFINLLGPPELTDSVNSPLEQQQLIESLSRLFAQINALVEAKEGFLQNWTYHRYSDILVYFGIPNSRTDDAIRATTVASEIRNLICQFQEVEIGNQQIPVNCQIGLAWGTVLAGEIGQPSQRKDYNALGAPVNRAACVMSQAPPNQIWITNAMVERIEQEQTLLNIDHLPFGYRLAEKLRLKGSENLTPIFEIIPN